MNMPILPQNYRERILAQKIQLLEQAIKASIQKPSLDNTRLLSTARQELFVFVRGGK